jgi:SAM-dependent methyltransferase
VDLTWPQTLGTTITASYDVIVFAEVLEHLVVNPVELFSSMLGLLRPNGSIYLTTPNFFSRKHLEQIRNHENPQEVFPRTNGNWDAHYHHREYGIKELLRFVDQAGGTPTGWYFSDCWDQTDPSAATLAKLPASQRGNIVMTFTRMR